MKINHFGFLTKNIEKSLNEFKALGYTKYSELINDNLRGVDILFIKSINGEVIELVSPSFSYSIVSSIVDKQKNMIYHTCYETNDINEKIKELSNKGFILIDSPKPAIAFEGKLVAFMLSKNSGMIELLEVKK